MVRQSRAPTSSATRLSARTEVPTEDTAKKRFAVVSHVFWLNCYVFCLCRHLLSKWWICWSIVWVLLSNSAVVKPDRSV